MKSMTNRNTKKYPLIPGLVERIQQWAAGHTHFQYLNGNGHSTGYGTFPHMIFVGKQDLLISNSDSFEKLGNYLREKDWIYGYFSYELKNEIEKLQSANPATIAVDHLTFVVPNTIIKINQEDFEVDSVYEPDDVFRQIRATDHSFIRGSTHLEHLKTKTTKDQYIDNVNKIKRAIVEGEYYEMNYCIEYTTCATGFDPVLCYQRLNDISPMPFSSLMKIDDIYLICASPERFLKKIENKIISQPIKGTIKRSLDQNEDKRLKKELRDSEKEQAENLMIVDLVRNDLARSSETGTVEVEELFGIYTFRRVHQMISTVTSRQNPKCSSVDVIKHAFPMGSMTGAPKIRVMEEIEKLEDSARGLYSGAIGYFTPEGDFDLNVVIRSIVYDLQTGNISFHVGSAITYDSDPEYEYHECLLKAESLFEVLSQPPF
jgi:para-aminobenzoate synthetase component 1